MEISTCSQIFTQYGSTSVMPTPLLQTKLHIPYEGTEKLLVRPRLHDALSQGLARKLTLVAAPAGFGKTALVCKWLRDSGHAAAWLSLDAGDNELTHFLRYLTAALHRAYPQLGDELMQIIDEAELETPEPFLAELLHELEEAAARKPAQKLILVLDDYHVITAEPIHAALRYLLDHLPRTLHLILTTRADPPLPLARMRVRRQLSEIRIDSLRFSPEELGNFFEQIVGASLSRELVQQLTTRTEGWIAGAQLAGLSLQGMDAERAEQFVAALSGSDRYIADYLLDEVLLHQPESIRTFLLHTSILEQLSPGLCDAVTGQSNSYAVLRQLEAGNFFLIALDHAQQWYRYHHLFLDLLRAQLHYEQPAAVAELHRSACDWYAANDGISQALHHAFAAGDTERAAQLVEQNAFAFVLRGNLRLPLTWLGQLPERVIEQSATLSLTHAWILSFTSEIEQIEPLLQNVERQLASLENGLGHSYRLQVDLLRAFVTIHSGAPEAGLEEVERLLGSIPRRETRLRATALLMLAEGYNVLGRLPDIQRTLAESTRLFQQSDAFTLTMLTASGLTLAYIIQGRLRAAEETCSAMMAWAMETGRDKLPATALMLVNLAEVCREQNRLEEAEAHLSEGLRLAELSGFSPAGSDGYWTLGQLRRGQRDWPGAETALNRALSIRPGDYGPSTVAITTQKVRLWIERGSLHLADEWAERTELSLADEPTVVHDLEYLALCRVAMAHGETEAALAMLHKLQTVALEDGRMARVMEVLVLQALAYAAEGATEKATSALAEALTMGQPEGFVRLFVDEGEAMVPLLRRAASAGTEPEFVTSLLHVLQAELPDIDDAQPLVEPLSQRELEVLELVAQGHSNGQISQELVISVATTKKHMSNILGKLSASNRTEAVRRARELHIF